MAVTVTPNLTLISDADTPTSQGAWSGNSGQQDTEAKVQGVGSYTWQAAKNARTACTFTPTTNLNLTAAYTYPHIYFWISCAVFPFAEAKKVGTTSPSGLTIRLTDGSGNYREWHVAGKDTWGGEWKCFVIDPSNTNANDVYASSGTLILTDIDIITFYIDISNSGTIRIIDNVWNDVIRFGEGLTLTGTDFTLVDAAAIDQGVDYQYGILQNIDGVIFTQGKINIGNGATTTTFNSNNEALIYRRRPIGAATVAAGAGLGMVNANLYNLTFTGSGCDAVAAGLVCKSAGIIDGLRHTITGSAANSLTISGSTFIRSKIVTFGATSNVQNSVFNNCFQIVPGTSVFKYNTVSNYVGSGGGALLYPSDDTNLQYLTFINNTDAIKYDATSDSSSPSFRGHQFDDVGGKYDVNNTSGGTVEIAKLSSSNPNSYNPGGSEVTFTASAEITISAPVSLVGAEVRIYDYESTPPDFGTELEGVESHDAATYVYSGSPDNLIYIQILLDGYEEFGQQYTIPSTNSGFYALLKEEINT